MTDWEWVRKIQAASICPCCDKSIPFEDAIKLVKALSLMREALERISDEDIDNIAGESAAIADGVLDQLKEMK